MNYYYTDEADSVIDTMEAQFDLMINEATKVLNNSKRAK